MEISECKVEPVVTIKVPVNELTAEYLVKTQGLDMETAEAIIQYANLFTGSNRKTGDDFLEMFRNQGDTLKQQGISVQHEIMERDPITKMPIRISYTADWQRPDAPPPRGERGAFRKAHRNPPILEKNFIVQKIIKK